MDESKGIFNVQVALVLVLTVAAVVKIWPHYQKIRRIKRMLSVIKGPTRRPLVGNAIDFLNKSSYDLFQMFQKWHDDFGDVFVASLGYEFGVFLRKPQDIEIILSSVKHIDKSREYSYLNDWLGTGLLTSTGSKWMKRRKLITPTFHFNILKQFVLLFDEHSKTLVKKLRIVADAKALDIMPIISSYTLDVICETAMGVNLNSQNNPDISYVKAIKITSKLFINRVSSIIGRFDLTYKLFSFDYKKSLKAIKTMHDFTDDVIRQRRELLKSSTDNQVASTKSDFQSKQKLAFLDMLLQSHVDGKPLSDRDIREEVDTFMFEGHDTTSMALAFGLMLLSKYPVVQKRLYDDLKQIMGDHNKTLTFDNLNQMKYLECVIKETLRLYPSVPLIGRTINEDVQLSDNSVIPSGSLVFCSIFMMQRYEQNFENAEKFIPERFEEEHNVKKTHFDYVPFSAGPRNCIGQKFAVLEMKYALATIILNFELLPTDHTPKVTAELVLRPVDGVTLRIAPRNRV